MLMRDIDIEKAINSQKLIIEPFDRQNLQGASYDLNVGAEAFVSNSENKVLLSPETGKLLHLKAGDFALLITKQKLKFPLDVAGTIGMRSTLARKGLLLLCGMQIDPGFEGHLRFGLYNASPRKITLDYGDELCTIEFHQLSGDVKRPAPIIPELIEGKIPESDRDYLSNLETTSLSDLSQNVRSLSQSVEALTNLQRWFLIPTILAILAGVIASVIVGIFK